MAPASPAADEGTELLQKLSLDSQTNTLEAAEATKTVNVKKPSTIQYSSVDGEIPSGPIPSREQSTTPSLSDFMDPSMCYYPNAYQPGATYYYGGYDGSMNEWEEYPRYVHPDGVEMTAPGLYGDSGSLMYQQGYGYAPYGAYPPPGSPVPTMGHDGQLYGPQHYQYAAPYYLPPTPDATYAHNQAATQGEASTSVAADQAPLPVEKGNGNAKGSDNLKDNGPIPPRPNYPSSLQTSNGSYGRGRMQGGAASSGYQDQGFRYDGPIFSDGRQRTMTSSSASATTPPSRNQNLHPLPLMGLHPRPPSGMSPSPGFMSTMYPNNRVYSQFGNMVRTGPSVASGGFNFRTNGRGWVAADNKYKPRGQANGFYGYGNENADGLNELNRGPRAGRFKNQRGTTPNITIAGKGENLSSNGNNDEYSAVLDSNQYNQADFPVQYSGAKFFVIKSYSEDDIHRSIKYSVWASTPNGNKKLDAAYREAQDKSEGCPVFLFFSVNTSGQFVGLAEMVGPVDFNKKVEYWQQDKWIGCFPVKWHIVKDVPNSLLKHITLENNDYKPVTNSRDTQEVKFEQGLEMLKIFKDHVSKSNMLEDFLFYEARQKAMQERKAKLQPIQKQVQVGKASDATAHEKDEDVSNTNARLQEPLEQPKATNQEAGQGTGDRDLSDNGLVAGAGDAPTAEKPAS
ncbi:YTH domain-containing protein [Cinnamomum micranthum f. kanehirae]|uniref:YTH domain-containing family protein n=1 Tax=Cinnamomum micranthum f. kanehirae TaxID=337451 RepID=A0A443NPK2_9MAGN|nr:YTH domain-containing protein [Cinnamomum micranthum f. kanehirae]